MANPSDTLELHELGSESSSGSGDAVDLGELRSAARLALEVTEITGALTVTLETSANGSSGWRSVDSWPVATETGKVERAFVGCSRYVRISWAFGGGGQSAAFAVTGEGHQVYFSESDVTSGAIARGALAEISKHVMAFAILAGSDDIENALASAYTMPIVKWPPSVSQRGAEIAAWVALKQRGTQTDGPDLFVKDAHDQAQSWLNRIAAGRLRPPGIVDSTPETYEGGGVVVSGPLRGW